MSSGQWTILAIAGVIVLLELVAAGKTIVPQVVKNIASQMFSGPATETMKSN